MSKIAYILFFISLVSYGQNTIFNTKIAEPTFPDGQRVYVDSPFSDLPRSGNTYFVATSGNSGNTGLSEGQAWTLQHALSTAVAGDLVWVKSGSYTGNFSQSNNGTVGNGIIFRGYDNAIGDIVSTIGSTFVRTNTSTTPNSTDYPVIQGADGPSASDWGINQLGDYVQFENLVFADYGIGILQNGDNTYWKNVITYSNYVGWGGQGANVQVENAFALNDSNRAFNWKGLSGHIVNSVVWSDTTTTPEHPDDGNSGTGYYFQTNFQSLNTIVEGCTIYRIPEANASYFGSQHEGHGFVAKDGATGAIYRNCVAYNTGIEANFGDVTSNLWEDIEIYGDYSGGNSQLSAAIRVLNGADGNTFRNILIEDSGIQGAIAFINFDDGQPGADETEGSNNNTFENIIINKAQRIFFTFDQESAGAATSVNNTFENITANDIALEPFRIDHAVSGTEFINCNFSDLTDVNEVQLDNGASKGYTFDYVNFFSHSFTTPTGTNITTLDPMYQTSPPTSIEHFRLQSGSGLTNTGKDSNDVGFQFPKSVINVSTSKKKRRRAFAHKVFD